MKKIFILLLSFSLTFFFCQKVELKQITDSSQIFKGEIAGVPVTLQLHYDGIPDCNLYQHFVEGWYYYDKYQKKIPLTGLYDYGKLSLYNFGSKHQQISKQFKERINSPQDVEKVAEIVKALVPKETILFGQDQTEKNPISGSFYLKNKDKAQPAKLFTGNDMIYRYNNYLALPNNKRINTFDVINLYGGNELVSYISGEKGNRVLLYFDHSSNLNACGRCGASEGEKGYRVLYFTKDWNYKRYEEFLTESCMENIYDTTQTKSKDGKTIQYKIRKSDSSPAYTLTVDIKNASATKSK
ncbi:hypothetical protein BBH99_00865 [Chryseobacterium contaminans]|uniref:Uncharacterized protein n=1 Tax=Chryseobacterium contaminans TaxID=1423959 RepID=A0A1M6VY34_9FLAO|nr:hypothetical protein [Chryseobacterium contaminans]OCA79130.1 hypothetical protein BBH99_00865 [Chryseobacterium contaminans]SHK86349.1 hypothetical protein SAMN05444407_101411 [Chryseobacterium contaminans]